MKKLLVPIICATAALVTSCSSRCEKNTCKDSTTIVVDSVKVKSDSLVKDSVK